MELQSLGRFRLTTPLVAVSASSRFYLAQDGEQDSPTLLAKLQLPGRGPDGEIARAQFAHEIRLLQNFNHPGIPSLHAAGEQDGVSYYIMDYVDGVDLARLLGHDRNEPRPLPKELAVYILAQLADALRYVHELEFVAEDGQPHSLEVVHRDICPGNVLISREGDVMLIDFGASRSRWLAEEHDMPGVGHRAYMAPERITGTNTTARSDLFSMAVILWEMLRGERCFWHPNEPETMDAIVRFDPAATNRRVSGLSPKLSEILRRNLDRDPARRYDDAYQMLQRLAQAPEAQAAEAARKQLAELVREQNA